jgi:exopolysaccharide biosynthesis polyprenyl glycosylphosphotransferase
MKFPKLRITTPSDPAPSQLASRTEADVAYTFYSKSHFDHMLRVERKRTERSKTPFLLLLLDISAILEKHRTKELVGKIQSILASCLRETDIRGWYEHNRIIGVIFTEMMSLNENTIDGIFRKIHDRFTEQFDPEWIKTMRVNFHIYPETNGKTPQGRSFDLSLYPDLAKQDIPKKFSMTIKKAIDFVGSSTAILLFSPVFIISAVAIKTTSKGPVFFRQKRMGENGKIFTMFKFRSMYMESDQEKHKKYIEKYILEQNISAVEPGVFKLNNDSRITPVGRFLRKTSLDELPQFINVLKGDMSLVGPRPPIPYECDLYDIWHRRRLLTCKPGITGLWQVTGRSRTTFDEMVRLDLKYISEWSLWLDLKILIMTPKAVMTGKGAY